MGFGMNKNAAEAETVTLTSRVEETVIGAQTKFKGTVSTDKPIRIDGIFEGEIVSTGEVVVSEGAFFNGTINCAKLTLIGSGEGKIVCTELLDVANIGTFNGDILTKDLVVTRGSKLEGTCKVG